MFSKIIVAAVLAFSLSLSVNAQVGLPSTTDNWTLPPPTLIPDQISPPPKKASAKTISSEDSIRIRAKEQGFDSVSNKAMEQIKGTLNRLKKERDLYELAHRFRHENYDNPATAKKEATPSVANID
jgi:hypothetical protein